MERDDILELAAQMVEEPSLLDLKGILSKRKRDREDANLRMRVRAEQRTELADLIRSLKTNRKHDAISMLAVIANLPPGPSVVMHLIDAWPLAWRGWLNIDCVVRCNGNSAPETEYRIELTDEGRAALAAASTAHPIEREKDR